MDNLSQVNLILLTQTFHVLLTFFSNESKFFCRKIKEEMLKIGKNLKSRFINDNIKNIFRQRKAKLLFPRSEFNLTVLMQGGKFKANVANICQFYQQYRQGRADTADQILRWMEEIGLQ